MTGRRYPIQPLARAMGCSTHTMGARLGISGTTYKTYRDHGVAHVTADNLAIRAGYHPYEIWPEMHGHDLADTTGLPDHDETADDRRRRQQREYLARRRAA